MKRLSLSLFLIVISGFSPLLKAKSISGIELKSNKEVSVQIEEQNLATVIVFLSSRCPCSQSHESELIELNKIYQDQGIQFVGIHSNADEIEPTDIQYFKTREWGFPIISDPKSKIANEFAAFKSPHVFILSPEGKQIYMGGISDCREFAKARKFYLREVLEDLVADRKLRHQKTMAVGCVIKRPS